MGWRRGQWTLSHFFEGWVQKVQALAFLGLLNLLYWGHTPSVPEFLPWLIAWSQQIYRMRKDSPQQRETVQYLPWPGGGLGVNNFSSLRLSCLLLLLRRDHSSFPFLKSNPLLSPLFSLCPLVFFFRKITAFCTYCLFIRGKGCLSPPLECELHKRGILPVIHV